MSNSINDPFKAMINWIKYGKITPTHNLAYFTFNRQDLIDLYNSSSDGYSVQGIRFNFAKDSSDPNAGDIFLLANAYLDNGEDDYALNCINISSQSSSSFASQIQANAQPPASTAAQSGQATEPISIATANTWIEAYQALPFDYRKYLAKNEFGQICKTYSILFENNEDYLRQYLIDSDPAWSYVHIHLAAKMDNDPRVKPNQVDHTTFIFSLGKQAHQDTEILSLSNGEEEVLEFSKTCPPIC